MDQLYALREAPDYASKTLLFGGLLKAERKTASWIYFFNVTHNNCTYLWTIV
jgi:hypothetical protein